MMRVSQISRWFHAKLSGLRNTKFFPTYFVLFTATKLLKALVLCMYGGCCHTPSFLKGSIFVNIEDENLVLGQILLLFADP